MRTIFKYTWLKILLIILFFYSFFGFVILPYLIQSNFTNLVKKHLNTNGYLSRVYINPFSFKIGFYNLIIQDDKNKTLLYFKSFETNFELTELFLKKITLDYITIDSLKTSLSLYKNGEFNFKHIKKHLSQNKAKESTKKEESSFIFTINQFLLTNTRLDFSDYTKSKLFTIKTKPFDFEIENFSTQLHNQAKMKTNIKILDTAYVDLNARLVLSPLKIGGDISLQNIQLKKIYSYLKDDIQFLFSGTIENIATSFDVELSNNTTLATLQNFTIGIPTVYYTDGNYSFNVKKLQHTIKKIDIVKNDLFNFDLKSIFLSSENIEFKDNLKNRNNPLNFKNISLTIDKFSSKKKEKSNILLAFKTPNSGDINLALNAKQEPVTIQGDINIQKMNLTPYSPYLKEFVNIKIDKTFVDVNTKIEIDDLKHNIKANIKFSNIDLSHRLTQERLIQAKTFDIKGLGYTNNNLFIQNILLDNFTTAFKIDTNKNTNFDNLIPEKNKEKENKVKNTKEKSQFHYYIKNIKISNGKTAFGDHSLPLDFDTNIHSLETSVKNLSSKNDEANIKLQGVVEKYGLANINAKTILANYKDKTDVTVKFQNLDIKSFSPYSGKFIGQKIADGRLWLDLDYKIRDSKLLSSNNIKMKNLTLGEVVKSPDALSLPVGLAIALLEDGNGLIELDVPITGDMGDPKFELSGVIWKTLRNVITNIVTAPFKFLGSLLGIKSDELGTVKFHFAKTDITPPQKEKLDKLIEVLAKKRKLSIVLQPTINSVKDTQSLQISKFKLLVQSDDKNARIKQLYKERFGEEDFNTMAKKYKDEELAKELSRKIKSAIVITKEELNALAYKRVNTLKTYFVSHKLQLDRIQIKKDILDTKDSEAKELSLKLELNIKE